MDDDKPVLGWFWGLDAKAEPCAGPGRLPCEDAAVLLCDQPKAKCEGRVDVFSGSRATAARGSWVRAVRQGDAAGGVCCV